jgi:type VI secretion system secreted protein VgrG
VEADKALFPLRWRVALEGYAQAPRLLEISSPLGPDALLLVDMRVVEALSEPFRLSLTVLSQRSDLGWDELVGKPVDVSLALTDDAKPRRFHGIISRMTAGPPAPRGQREYRLEAVPWLWLLTRTADCRIFQKKTAVEIAKDIFDELGFRDCDVSGVRRTLETRDYCVQWRETDFDFVSRLFEEEGIFYFFRHERGKHTLVLSDTPTAYVDCPEAKLEYITGTPQRATITSWEHAWEMKPGAYAHTDYNFETPSTKLLTSRKTVVKPCPTDKLEWFDYPGGHMKRPDGEARASLRIEEEEAGFDLVEASSGYRSLLAGGKFTLEKSAAAKEEGQWTIARIEHLARTGAYHAGEAGGESYENSFTCFPAAIPWRPPRRTPKPSVRGIQSAVVVGPAGEEIYTDEHGRIKVQFHWDRLGKKDEKSSCWVRVAHPVAGKGWGFMSLPRIGQEVVVDFVDGDPDRPLVLGSVYNAEQKPPFAVPANKTQTGFRSRSSKGGSGANCNELRFEDKKGEEQVYLHAEKNQDFEVENDETHGVGHDRAKTIGNDETTQVGHDRTETVGNNETITIGANRTETVMANETITIQGMRTEFVALNEAIVIGLAREEAVGVTEAVAIGVDRNHTIGKDDSLDIGSDQSVKVGSNRSINVGKDESVEIGKNRAHKVGENDSLDVAKNLSVAAGDQITITCGSANITLKKNGDILINGKNITMKGSGDVVIKGQKILEN